MCVVCVCVVCVCVRVCVVWGRVYGQGLPDELSVCGALRDRVLRVGLRSDQSREPPVLALWVFGDSCVCVCVCVCVVVARHK